jgi:hypothetical protein
MPLDYMGANHIGAAAGNHEIQRSSNALLSIIGLAGADDITLALSNFALPKVNNNPIEVGYLNETRKFAGRPVFDDISVVVKDYVDVPVSRVLQNWRRLVYDPVTGQIGLASQYKKTCTVKLYAPNGTLDRELVLLGCWPAGLDLGEADMNGDDVVSITMNMTYDKYVVGGIGTQLSVSVSVSAG